MLAQSVDSLGANIIQLYVIGYQVNFV